MRKVALALAVTAALSMGMGMTAFAGQWQTNEFGWQYQQDDGTYAEMGWNWIDGRCYYFEPVYRYMDNPVCAINQTVDLCYTVDETGALVINGIIVEEGSDLAKKLLGDNFSGAYEGGYGEPEIDICAMYMKQVVEKGSLTSYDIVSQTSYNEFFMEAESNTYYGIAKQTLDENGNPMLVLPGNNWVPIAYYKKAGNTLTLITDYGQYTYQKK